MSQVVITYQEWIGPRWYPVSPSVVCRVCGGRGRIRYCKCPCCDGAGARPWSEATQ